MNKRHSERNLLKVCFAVLCAAVCIAMSSCASDTAEEDMKKAIILGGDESTATETSADETLEIKENSYVQQVNAVYENPKAYIGKKVKFEGMYTAGNDIEGEAVNMVYRIGPGHDGGDEEVGFEIIYDGDAEPQENDWVEVTGQIEYIIHGGYKFVGVQAVNLLIKEERGLETVGN